MQTAVRTDKVLRICRNGADICKQNGFMEIFNTCSQRKISPCRVSAHLKTKPRWMKEVKRVTGRSLEDCAAYNPFPAITGIPAMVIVWKMQQGFAGRGYRYQYVERRSASEA